jgi:hypothetical protein
MSGTFSLLFLDATFMAWTPFCDDKGRQLTSQSLREAVKRTTHQIGNFSSRTPRQQTVNHFELPRGASHVERRVAILHAPTSTRTQGLRQREGMQEKYGIVRYPERPP